MSFLLDPPMLVASGALIERAVSDEETAQALQTAVATVFIAGSAALWLNAPTGRAVWRAFGEDSGRDFMVNSGVLDIDHERGGAWSHVVATAILATYPLWVRLGRRLASR